ncbi:uncharacterized protein LOC115985873 [Quercus lobata]|uniref:Pectinesterase inhibitor domain-containing protein n=1 Tax=Quercus lobata TaxID=97700 RepID=A0A7N2LJC3_QUELO|nr:uncharacterized protein LOC115985873 [Quercus lobata]
MVFKDYTFSLYVFLAVAVILFTGHIHGAGLCDNSPNKQVCYSIVYNRTVPRDATVAACHKLVYETKDARVVAQRQGKSLEIDLCITEFNRALNTVKHALTGLEARDYLTVKAYINGTQLNYETCDYFYQHYGKINPIAKTTKHLKDIASVGAYLATLLK